MATVIRSLGITGITGYPMGVEVAIIAGMPGTTIVGLGDSAVKEAKDRMEACTGKLRYAYPTKKMVINLSPSLDFEGWRIFFISQPDSLRFRSQLRSL